MSETNEELLAQLGIEVEAQPGLLSRLSKSALLPDLRIYNASLRKKVICPHMALIRISLSGYMQRGLNRLGVSQIVLSS